jgi:NADH dehydrogenase
MTVLVVGATGDLGGLIARGLLDQGRDVRILVREGSSYDTLVAAGAKAVVGDLKEPDSLSSACDGVESVVTTANSIGRSGADTIESVDLNGNRNLVDAAEAAGVRRFLFTSALGADAQSPVDFLRAKAETEQRLHASGMVHTILQPNLYMEIWIPAVVGGAALGGGQVTLVGEGHRKHSFISRSDVGHYAVAALDHKEAEGQTLALGGPEGLSWRDVVAAFERELGREITVNTVPPGEPVPGLPPMMSGLLAAMDGYDSIIEMTEPAATYGVTPTSLDEFVHGFVGAATAQVDPTTAGDQPAEP